MCSRVLARVSHDSSKPMDLPTVSEVSPNFLRLTSRPEAPVHDGLPGNTAWIPRTRDLFFSAPLRLSASVAVLALSWSPPDQQGALRVLTCLRSLPVLQDLYLASVYVSDAQYNRNIFFDTSPQAVR